METTKQNIINKAFALFLTTSYREVTLSRLLKETNLSKGAFYHHFSSKEELFTEVAEQFFFGAAAGMGFTPSPMAGFVMNMENLLDAKKKAFNWFAGNYGVDQKELNFFMFIAEAIRYLPGVREKVRAMVESEKQQVKAILLAAADSGELRPEEDPDFLAGHIVKAFDGYEMHGVLLGYSAETIEREKEMVRQLWEMIKNRQTT
jgi:TetR/AcrR family transcriptional regulator, transcriptional repressor for nem operon